MAKPNVISKEELLHSAQRCIVGKGLDKTTLKAVAEASHVSQGTVFYHFRTKEQLILEVVKQMCDASWQTTKAAAAEDDYIAAALNDAKERCGYDSSYHQLFFSSLAASFHNESIRGQLGRLVGQENEHVAGMLAERWGSSPVPGMSLEGWGMLINAMIDGLVVQALLSESFPKDAVFKELELLLRFLQQHGEAVPKEA